MSAGEVALLRLPHGADLALPGYATEMSAGMDLLAAVETAAKGLARQGFLLDRDLAAILNRAARRFDRQTARSGNDEGCAYLR
jgi:dUTP pyrophosphatase